MEKLENENAVKLDGRNSGDFSGDACSDGRVCSDECSTESSQEDSGSTIRNGYCEETNTRKNEGDDNDDESGISSSYKLDQFWLPPEPEYSDDDIEDSVTNYDDDECGDDPSWGKPTALISFGEEGSRSFKFKEEKQKAFEEVMNGKLKVLVNDLLKSFCVASSGGDDDWVDIVSTLSWEAASFVKPDSAEGEAMDPNRHVKIKCVTTGSPSQSRFIRGLVFKKHAAHKHMPAKFDKPRLLLIEGALGLSSSELSSFESMTQEKDTVVKSITEILERYQPNVILVEKAVTRDIQESILGKGLTVVSDMKEHRLERIARCTVSPTLSSKILSGQKLRQCDSFHFERFVEEHDTSADGGKRTSKTLMFIEGCPTRLGCTILLMGANSDELKKVKCVVRYAVIMAYNLIQETSFLLDQKAMFSTIPLSGQTVTAEELSVSAGQENLYAVKGPVAEAKSSRLIDVPIPNGFHHEVSHNLEDMGDSSDEETAPEKEQLHTSLMSLQESFESQISSERPQDQRNMGDDITSSIGTESILVLTSSRNASRGTMCAHRFFRIKFYQNFDKSLGKFLLDDLLSQKLPCNICDGSPEAHILYYAHFNKLLAVQVRRLPTDKGLSGESEGKIWMWSRCGRCKFHIDSSKSTKRVLMSTGSQSFSFGKFLEFSFSDTSLFNKLSVCGHSFHRDFLYFFGLGHMVAVFKYSTVTTYSVSLPPLKLEFSSSINGEFLKKDFENVHMKGIKMFFDIEKALKAMESRFVGTTLNLQGSIRKFCEIEEMLKEERIRFETDIQNAVMDGNGDVVVYKLLSLTRIRLDLLYESSVWDHRLHSLLSADCIVADPKTIDQREKQDNSSEVYVERDDRRLEDRPDLSSEVYVERDDRRLEDRPDLKINVVEESPREDNSPIESTEGSSDVSDDNNNLKLNVALPVQANGFPNKDVLVGKHDSGSKEQDEPSTLLSAFTAGSELSTAAEVNGNGLAVQDLTVKPSLSDDEGFHDYSNSLKRSLSSIFPNTKSGEGWWNPFPEIRRQYLEVLQRGNLPELGSIMTHAVESTAYKLFTDEGAKLRIPLGSDNYIVSDYEDEFSSIIACALALRNNFPFVSEDRGIGAKAYEIPQFSMRIFSLASPHLSSTGSLDLAAYHSSNLSQESRSLSFDSSVSSTDFHLEVSMGLGKLHGKHKYSVLCLYACRFRNLRDRWCPSEVDFIASISRCRSWDAKGGKSKSLFAKTVDDRFIIKEIKRAEFDSFLKFAPRYFEYMNQCYENRNPTCLAKILGIYQVNVRPTKGGKETRHDLMVMENLSFGRVTTRQYDLKGALHSRFSEAGTGAGDVLLDQNFVKDMNESPLYVGTRSKWELQRAVWNDCGFLKSINVMDYSLLVGVDAQRRELVCGIIDYLRQYTWDKQIENWVKTSLVVPRNQLPTVVSPKEYKKRFRKFIDTHFLSVPEHWCSQKILNTCKPNGMISGIASPKSESDGDSDQPKCNGEGGHEDTSSSDNNSTAQGKQNGSITT